MEKIKTLGKNSGHNGPIPGYAQKTKAISQPWIKSHTKAERNFCHGKILMSLLSGKQNFHIADILVFLRSLRNFGAAGVRKVWNFHEN